MEEKSLLSSLGKSTVVKTTLGDLICAISEAIEESECAQQQIGKLTQIVLARLLDRSSKQTFRLSS